MSNLIYAVEGAKYWKDLEATEEAKEGDPVARVTHPDTEKGDLVQPALSRRPILKNGELHFDGADDEMTGAAGRLDG